MSPPSLPLPQEQLSMWIGLKITPWRAGSPFLHHAQVGCVPSVSLGVTAASLFLVCSTWSCGLSRCLMDNSWLSQTRPKFNTSQTHLSVFSHTKLLFFLFSYLPLSHPQYRFSFPPFAYIRVIQKRCIHSVDASHHPEPLFSTLL